VSPHKEATEWLHGQIEAGYESVIGPARAYFETEGGGPAHAYESFRSLKKAEPPEAAHDVLEQITTRRRELGIKPETHVIVWRELAQVGDDGVKWSAYARLYHLSKGLRIIEPLERI